MGSPDPGGTAEDADPKQVILVVDDEPAVRATLAAMLTHHGYDPRAVGCGADAVEACRGGGVAAAILDVRMPGMDGLATLDALRMIAPTLPCEFVSGDTGKYTARELLNRGAAAVLPKPVSLADLGRAVSEALAGSVD